MRQDMSVSIPLLAFERHHHREAFMVRQFVVSGQQVFLAKRCLDESQSPQELIVIRACPNSNCDEPVPIKVLEEFDEGSFVSARFSFTVDDH
jgi:hypothetical protein